MRVLAVVEGHEVQLIVAEQSANDSCSEALEAQQRIALRGLMQNPALADKLAREAAGKH